jgi:DNA-binding NarL/FixJ family response regulator
VLLVEDHPAVRHGIRQLLTADGDMEVVAAADRACKVTGQHARWVDVAVIDYHLPDRNGLWLTRRIKQLRCPPPVLIYSAFADARLAAAAIIAGADGLVRKSAVTAELQIAIRRLLHGRSYFPTIPKVVEAALCARLAPRDRAIYSMLIHELAPTEVAARLGITLAELRDRRHAIVDAIAPNGAVTNLRSRTRGTLDYRRPHRRYPTVG